MHVLERQIHPTVCMAMQSRQEVGQTKVHCGPDLPKVSSPSLCLPACMVAVEAEQGYCLACLIHGWVIASAVSSYARVGALLHCSALCSPDLSGLSALLHCSALRSADSSLHGHQTQSHVCSHQVKGGRKKLIH